MSTRDLAWLRTQTDACIDGQTPRDWRTNERIGHLRSMRCLLMNVSKIKLRIRRNSKARPLRKLAWLDVRLCLFVFFCQTFYKHWIRRWLASWQAGWLCDWLWFLSSSLLLLSLIVGHLLFHNIYRSVSQSAVPFSHDSWFIGFFKFLRANKLPSVFLRLK